MKIGLIIGLISGVICFLLYFIFSKIVLYLDLMAGVFLSLGVFVGNFLIYWLKNKNN